MTKAKAKANMTKKAEAVTTKDETLLLTQAIAKALELKDEQVTKLVTLESELRALKVAKENAKQKVIRAKMRNLKFYRSELSDEVKANFEALYALTTKA